MNFEYEELETIYDALITEIEYLENQYDFIKTVGRDDVVIKKYISNVYSLIDKILPLVIK